MSHRAPSTTTTWLTLTVLSPGAALTLFWFALHATNASINHHGSSTNGRIGLVVAILMVPTVAMAFTIYRWRQTTRAGRRALIAGSITGIALTSAIGFLEVIATWLEAMGT